MKPAAEEILLIGIDLAWGEKRPDGVCKGIVRDGRLTVEFTSLLRGDQDFTNFLESITQGSQPVFLAMDAPVVCPNSTGSRPVDREAQRIFRKQHAGPHPCNRQLCKRPLRIVEKMVASGFKPGWDFGECNSRRIAEVFPHPAIVRWGQLKQIIKYKRGPVRRRREEFATLQDLLRIILNEKFPDVSIPCEVERLLHQPWTKDIEDQTDALICLLIAWQHVRSRCTETEILGDLGSGFILVPRFSGVSS